MAERQPNHCSFFFVQRKTQLISLPENNTNAYQMGSLQHKITIIAVVMNAAGTDDKELKVALSEKTLFFRINAES